MLTSCSYLVMTSKHLGASQLHRSMPEIFNRKLRLPENVFMPLNFHTCLCCGYFPENAFKNYDIFYG